MSKLFISVKHGMVDTVLSTNKRDTIKVFDWDGLDEEEELYESRSTQWAKLKKELHEVY